MKFSEESVNKINKLIDGNKQKIVKNQKYFMIIQDIF